MRILLLATVLATQGCIDTNEISGHWAISSDGSDGGCSPGEDIYVEVRDELADWFHCTEGRFAIRVSTRNEAFTVNFTVDDPRAFAAGAFGYVQLEHITDDFDIGLVTFDRN